ncbi:transcription initiation factor IIB [Lecanora helva]
MANGSQEQWKENLNMQMICKDCREVPPNLVEEFSNGDVVCGSCGLVLGERTIDTRSEWRTFANDDQGNDDPSRVGDAANPLLMGSQLETHIAYDRGASARSRDLHRAQGKSSHDKNNKSLSAVYREIGDLCSSMEFSEDVANYARFLYKQIYDAGAFKGKSPEAMNAGLIFIACRQQGVPRTFKEIQAFTKVPKADIGRMFKGLEKFFSGQSRVKQVQAEQAGTALQPQEDYATTQSTDPKYYCDRFCNKLGLGYKIVKKSMEIAERTDKLGSLAGRSPLSIAAACIYMASYLMGSPKTPKEIARVAGVSDGTIRHSYKLIYPRREELVEGDGDISALPLA